MLKTIDNVRWVYNKIMGDLYIHNMVYKKVNKITILYFYKSCEII